MAADCFSQLDQFHSKVTASQLGLLHERFDIPRKCRLIAPANSEAIYHHGGGRSPLYIRHMECGLRLPLHPFLRGVFEVLGVSPMQMKPNSIALLVGYVVICYWLRIDPSLNVLGHLVSTRFSKEAHYYLQGAGGFKIVTNLPESNKDWKERFVWVEGDDSGLECPDWPAIRKGVLVKKALSPSEQRDLDRILSYSGSRVMEDLLDDSVLRVAGVSARAPTERDVHRAERRAPKGRSVEGARRSTPLAREKRRREGSPKRTDVPSGRGEGPPKRPIEPAPEASGRMKRKKTTAGPRGKQRVAAVEAASTADSPVPSEEGEPRAEAPVGSTSPDGRPPEREGARAGSASPDDRPQGGEGPTHETEPTRREGKESAGGSEFRDEEADWTSRFNTLDVGEERWRELRSLLIGRSPDGPIFIDEPDEEHRHDPPVHLDSRASVLSSRPVQARVVHQFLLDRDDQLLREVPAAGLHTVLRSYLVRGCLVENEAYRRLMVARAAHARLKDEVAAYKEEAERAVRELSLKQGEADELRRESQVKDDLLERQRAENLELTRQLQGGGSGPSSAEALKERDLAAVRESMAVQRAESLKDELEEARIANNKLSQRQGALEESLALANSKIAHLESDAYKSSIIDGYRFSLLGKVEVALACKAGYDYLASQLPSELRGAPGRLRYPPSVAPFISSLSKIEERGGGYDVEAGGSGENAVEGEASAGKATPGDGTQSASGVIDGAGGSRGGRSSPPGSLAP